MESKFLSIEWFKEKLNIKSRKKELKNDFKYKNIKLINDCLTVVLEDGKIVSKVNCTIEDYNSVIKIMAHEEFVKFMSSASINDKREEIEQIKLNNEIAYKGLELLKSLSDFTVVDNVVYLVECNRSLPTLLVNKFCSIVHNHSNGFIFYTNYDELQRSLYKNIEYQSYKNFFLWCCLNPKPEVAKDLYNFIENNSFNITKQGFIVALRNVVTVSENTDIIDAVSNNYHKVKTIWKKNPKNYWINSDLKLIKGLPDLSTIDLKEMYLNLPNLKENRYTDARTKTFDIRVGQVVSMPLEECNYTTDECNNAGLHFTSKEINYVGCGDQTMLILINPMKIVGIGQQKGRCYEYLPIMTVSRDESTTILKDKLFDTLELEEDYAIKELENLQEKVGGKFIRESNIYNYELPKVQLTNKELINITKSLGTIQNEIKNRVIKI